MWGGGEGGGEGGGGGGGFGKIAYLRPGAWSRTRGVSLGSRVRGLGPTNASRPVRAGNHNEMDRQNYQGGGGTFLLYLPAD